MVYHILRTLLGLLFVGTGLVKLMDIPAFISDLGDFGVVLDPLVPATAWFISLVELVTGVGLLVNLRGSLLAALTMLVVFVGVLTYGIAIGLDIDCGCFGTAISIELKDQLLVDLGLIGLCGLVYVTGRRPGQGAADPNANREVIVTEREA
jgi:uncharacterized membrane protein YphA (DoxX/SURF4 family)